MCVCVSKCGGGRWGGGGGGVRGRARLKLHRPIDPIHTTYYGREKKSVTSADSKFSGSFFFFLEGGGWRGSWLGTSPPKLKFHTFATRQFRCWRRWWHFLMEAIPLKVCLKKETKGKKRENRTVLSICSCPPQSEEWVHLNAHQPSLWWMDLRSSLRLKILTWTWLKSVPK